MKKWMFFVIMMVLLTGCMPEGEARPTMAAATVAPIATNAPALMMTTTPVPTEAVFEMEAGSAFVHTQGRELVVGVDEEPIFLRGINFSNYTWDMTHEELLSVRHHEREDYFRVAELGMNVVRFNLSTYHFEDRTQPYTYLEDGWDWLDQEIAWAKEVGVYLILNIHFAPGMSADSEVDFWQTPEYMDRTVEVWRQIARRYRNEPTIAGYDLFNEPEPPDVATWDAFVDAMVAAIREEDSHHLLILEGIHSLNDGTGEWLPVENPYVSVDDDNYMYDFHFYLPFEFTHQKMEWAGIYGLATYPNERVTFDWDHMLWAGNQSGERLESGSTGWKLYSGEIAPIEDKTAVLGKPNPFCSQLGEGTASFADFSVKAYDQDGNFIEEAIHGFVDENQNWWFWSQDESGEWLLSADAPVGDGVVSTRSVTLTGIQQSGTATNVDFGFVVNPDYQYSIEGWMKGENISADTDCYFDMEWYSLTEGEPVIREDREYLAREMEKYIRLAEEANVPLNLGEFGVNWYGWQEDRGGDWWYADMFSIAVENDLHFQSWAYHDIFGIYTQWDVLPSAHTKADINYALMETLKTLFARLAE